MKLLLGQLYIIIISKINADLIDLFELHINDKERKINNEDKLFKEDNDE